VIAELNRENATMAKIAVEIYYDTGQAELEVTTKDVYGDPEGEVHTLDLATLFKVVYVTPDIGLGGSLSWLARAAGYAPQEGKAIQLAAGDRVRVYPGDPLPKKAQGTVSN
jgi:hypothetical protein